MDPLPVTIQITSQQIVIEAEGEVIEHALVLLQNVVEQALTQPDLPVVLDLRLATQIDDKGLSLIRTAGERFVRSRRGLTIRVVAGAQPARVLELSQMEEVLLRLGGREALYFFAIVADNPLD